jgi:hypothetical protein
MLQDMAILTGGQVISEEVGLKLENATLDLLGSAKRVIITKDTTTIVDGGGDGEDIKGRINQIKAEVENTDSDWDREKLQERLAKLSGGVAVIKVGAATEVELKEKKHRIEDALSATRAAIEEGVVAGGGTALLRSRDAVKAVVDSLTGDEATGAQTVWASLDAPTRLIAENAGLSGSILVRRSRADRSVGLNALTGELRTWSRPASSTRPRSPGCTPERGVHRRCPDHRVPVADKPEKKGAPPCRARHGRHGWNGRHGDDVSPPSAEGAPRPATARSVDAGSVRADWEPCLLPPGPALLHPPGGRVSHRSGLIAQAAQGSKSPLPIVFGAAVLLSAALTDGPLAGWKTVSRPAHKVVDIVLASVALLLAVLPWSGADASGRAVLLIAAALLGMLILRTSYAPKPVRAPRNRGDLAEDVGRSAGRMVGKGLKAYRDGRARETGSAGSAEPPGASGPPAP